MTRHLEYMVEFRPQPPLPARAWIGASGLGFVRSVLHGNEQGPRPAAYRVYLRRFWFFWFLIAESPPREGRGENAGETESREARTEPA